MCLAVFKKGGGGGGGGGGDDGNLLVQTANASSKPKGRGFAELHHQLVY